MLTTTARETGFLSGGTSSRIAQLAVVDVLVVRVAQRRRDAAETALRVTDEAVHRAHP